MSKVERKRNIIGAVLLALVVVLLGVLIFQGIQAAAERDTAQNSAVTSAQQKKNLAEEVADACRSGQVVKSTAGVDLCQRAATIVEQPPTVEGPAGPRGLPGADGEDGAPGATGKPGAPGAAGTNGAEGAGGLTGLPGLTGFTGMTGLPGLTGATGEAGEAGSPGVDGAPGPVGPPGPTGSVGAPGEDGEDGAPGAVGSPGADGATGLSGRGISDVKCVGDGNASYWLITYTDGTTDQSSGPCKVAAAVPVEPAPTEPTS